VSVVCSCPAHWIHRNTKGIYQRYNYCSMHNSIRNYVPNDHIVRTE